MNYVTVFGKYILFAGIPVLLFALSLLIVTTRHPQQVRQFASNNLLHVEGNQIIDGSGNPIKLRGGQIEMFNIAGFETNGTKANDTYIHFPQTVKVMHDVWHMNIVRLPTCNWLWQANPSDYITRVQAAVSQANQAGLYVILEAHDDPQCNPSYNPRLEPYHLPRLAVNTYWQTLASTFASNPMVLFDVYNEPNIHGRGIENYTAADWNVWLNGATENDENGQSVQYVGMQQLVNTVRLAGVKQIVMVEGYAAAETWHNINLVPGYFVHDTLAVPNIVYETHKYAITDTSNWDQDFGFLTQSPYILPVFVGEWALLGGDNAGQLNCNNVPAPQALNAETEVTSILQYMDAHNMNWTAYAFTQEHLIYTDVSGNYYTPTNFSSTWTCPTVSTSVINHAGMGQDIYAYLTNTLPSPTLTPSLSPTSTPFPSQSLTPTPLPLGTSLTISVGLHGIGMGGTNANQNAKGTMSPQHQTRQVTVTMENSQSNTIATVSGQIVFDTTKGIFSGTMLAPQVSTGDFFIKIKSDGFLEKQLAPIIHITAKQNTIIPQINLTNGDINNDNQISILDYSIIAECYGTKMSSSSCPVQYRPNTSSPGADIDDDNGQIDGPDYNLFLVELSVQQGQ